MPGIEIPRGGGNQLRDELGVLLSGIEGPVPGDVGHQSVVQIRILLHPHAFVAFEGFHPGDGPEGPAVTRGLDSLQLVRTAEGWRLASFTTQYEGDGLELPARFLRPGP